MKIAGGIVLYNPDIERLKENIEAIRHQVDVLILADNHSKNIDAVRTLLSDIHLEDYELICNPKNMGIAYALNQITEYSCQSGAGWTLFLDQDSVAPANMIEEYRKYLDHKDVVMLCPQIVDRNFAGSEPKQTEGGYKEVQRCITSGSFVKNEVFGKVGPFNNKLFIDQVDFEFTARLVKAGYKMYRINKVVLLHELGNSREVLLDGKKVVTTNHNPMRRYYAARNRVYCLKRYPKYTNYKTVIRYFINVPRLIFLYEEDKAAKIWAMVRGLFAGIFMR